MKKKKNLFLFSVKFLKKSDQDKTRVIRTCGYQKSNTPCYSVDNDHHLENVCQCFDDGCNSASNKSILSIISTLILVSTRWFIAWLWNSTQTILWLYHNSFILYWQNYDKNVIKLHARKHRVFHFFLFESKPRYIIPTYEWEWR